MAAIMVAFSKRVISHSSTVLAVAMRREYPFKQPSPASGPKNGDDRLIALLGNDVELDIVSLDVKSCIRERSL